MTEPAADTSEVLARRYGRSTPGQSERDRSRAMWIGGAGVAVIFTAGAVWFALGGEEDVATMTAASYTVLSESEVTLTFNVERPDPSLPVQCAAEATDASRAQVGVTLFDVPPGTEQDTPVTVSVVTFARAEQAQPIEASCFALE